MRKVQNHKASKFHKDALITTVTAPATTPDINKCLLSNIKVNTLQVEIINGAKVAPLSICFLWPCA